MTLTPTDFDLALIGILDTSASLFLDRLMSFLASGWIWTPLYLALLFCVAHNNKSLRHAALLVAVALAMVAATCAALSLFIEPAALRPFHAAGTFSVALMLSLVVRSGLLSATLFGWSLLGCLARMCLGQQYPTALLLGLLLGAVAGFVFYRLYLYIYNNVSGRMSHISSQLTSTGYAYTDVYAVLTVFFAILVTASIYAVAV